MQPFEPVHGVALPMMIPDIDTDQMINRDFLITTARKGLGRGLFHDLRYRDGREVADFVMNLPWFREPRVLIGGPNFASGSSREHAVWAVQDYGIRAVIAPSFGVHFRRNAFKNGLLPIVLPEPDVAAMADAVLASRGARLVRVDLETQTVSLDDGPVHRFEVEPDARTALLLGLDEIGRTQLRRTAVEAFQTTDRAARPWVYLHA
ncbi:3-isopropylmalate dehydratase small subunit [Salinarimonas sp. NSM]|uniref:3-isopropylmalate dehydratase small subunit n=1 Tax=Salinarimonas sp. NSM TaxID=3458003 RepID=UPI0040359A3C